MICFGCGQEKQYFLFSKEMVNSTLIFLVSRVWAYIIFYMKMISFFFSAVLNLLWNSHSLWGWGENTLSVKDDIFCSDFSLFLEWLRFSWGSERGKCPVKDFQLCISPTSLFSKISPPSPSQMASGCRRKWCSDGTLLWVLLFGWKLHPVVFVLTSVLAAVT